MRLGKQMDEDDKRDLSGEKSVRFSLGTILDSVEDCCRKELVLLEKGGDFSSECFCRENWLDDTRRGMRSKNANS
jgi:hypothetical protein